MEKTAEFYDKGLIFEKIFLVKKKKKKMFFVTKWGEKMLSQFFQFCRGKAGTGTS